eukprot:TRINITY_DN864_c2_g1_i1.p1 TRINITY_DN864_c2_g1~~TRINITY_DN864_c2_g1_i1.p1  ORF type:complete len:231 (+),score=57.03 TRINITY_DN864_c2_g1_i1:72-764(+)
MFSIICIATLLFSSAAGFKQHQHGQSHIDKRMHTLRVCNGYPKASSLSLQVSLLESSLRFQECKDFSNALEQKDIIAFKASGKKLGGFQVSEVPSFDSILLLVVYEERGDVAFKSHAFNAGDKAQVALIKAFAGSSSSPAIEKKGKSESFPYDSSLRLDSGNYELKSEGFKTHVSLTSGKVYVIMSTGPSQQDTIIYPRDDVVGEKSGAAAIAPASFVVALLAMFLATQF